MNTTTAFLAVLMAACPAAAQEKAKRDRTDVAIDRAVAYLTTIHREKDGAISDVSHNLTAMTSLAIMAMASVGHQPTDPSKEGRVMKRGLDYVLRKDRQDSKGYLGGADGSRMYGHGIITLMLGEMLGMGVNAEQDSRIRDRLERAVQLILKAQAIRKNKQYAGGWRYHPNAPDADLSVTVWQVMSLRSARNAGLSVPKEAIDRAVKYIKLTYYSKKRGKDGKPLDAKSACGYNWNRSPSYAMGAAGLLSLQVCGEYDAFEVKGSADWLKDRKLDYNGEYFFYGTYYYAQGMYQRGGEYAELSRKRVADVLLPRQEKNGSWRGRHGRERDTGKVYSTSLGVLCLAVKYHYLPIYQR